jgi:pilus assembly protein Flp/PilA
MLSRVRALCRAEDGLTSVEYALLLALLVVVALAAWQALGTNITAKISGVANAMK